MAISDPITNDADILDSRDIYLRLDYLESSPFRDLDEDEKQELIDLRDLTDSAMWPDADWMAGTTLIRESYFLTYAQEYADDIYSDLNRFGNQPTPWPFTHIDWRAAADDLRQDFTEVEFDGVTYLLR